MSSAKLIELACQEAHSARLQGAIELANLIDRLANQLTAAGGREQVMAHWMQEALQVLSTVEDNDGQNESLNKLCRAGDKLVLLILEPGKEGN